MRRALSQSIQYTGGQAAETTLPNDLQHPIRRIVVGLGNTILGDDGFGWVVADQLRLSIDEKMSPVDIECYSLGGLSLMECLVGYDHAVLIDAVHLGNSPVGTLYSIPLADLPDNMAGHLSASHDTTLKTAMEMGRSLGAYLPEHVMIVGVETANSYDFSEELSAPVVAAVPIAVQLVLDLLNIQGH